MKKLLVLQSVVLFCGVLFAWSTVASDFLRFSHNQGVNPLSTPCFYGAVGFLMAYFYSLFILFASVEKRRRHQQYLIIFLVAGTIFGWGNFTIEFCRFYFFKNPTSCSGLTVSTPFATPCFYGSVIYLLSLIVSVLTKRSVNHH